MSYIKEVFEAADFEYAKHVVLTSDPKNPNKFEFETKFLIDVIKDFNVINSESSVLDFGCGMGRVSRELINTFNCDVYGIDISYNMLRHAMNYVNMSRKFKPFTECTLINEIDVAISTFVIQHVKDPQQEIDRIYNALKDDGYFILVNENKRYVPSAVDPNNYVVWNDDAFNVFEAVEEKFTKIKSVPYLNTDVNIILYKKLSLRV